MAKSSKRQLRKVPENEQKQSIRITRNAKVQNNANNILDKQPALRHNLQTYRIRKCVVKIKRIKLPINYIVSNIPAVTPQNCRVRIKNISKNSTPRTKSSEIAPRIIAAYDDAIAKKPNSSTIAAKQTADATIKPLRVRVRRIQIPAAVDPKQNNATENALPRKIVNTEASYKQRFFHRDQPPPRTRSAIERNVYEFLSQSQIEDKAEPDPTADIVKKMIKDGRACAMMRLKSGKTRARAVKKKVRPVGKRKQCSIKSISEKLPDYANRDVQLDSPPHTEQQPLPFINEHEQNFSNVADHQPAEPDYIPQSTQNILRYPNRTIIDATYSPLARSLLLNQTKTQNSNEPIERRRQLLNMAKKFISTPFNRRTAVATANVTVISPIMRQVGIRQSTVVSSPGCNSSPWRIPDESPLPNTFVFNLNSSQLPSYSSDYIQKRHVYVPDEPNPDTDPVQSNSESIGPVSNSTVNDSNGENVPPTADAVSGQAVTLIRPSADENEDIENLVHFPNPRRTLQHRSPLKDINVLEVIELPSWKPPNTPIHKKRIVNNFQRDETNKSPQNQTPFNATQIEKQRRLSRNLFGFDEFLNANEFECNNIGESGKELPDVLTAPMTDICLPEVDTNKSRQCEPPFNAIQIEKQRRLSRNLFGFEEFLNENEFECNNVSETKEATLPEKLHRLKDMRPTDEELPDVSTAPMPYSYDDLSVREPKQRTIKDMLCSTMMHKPMNALGINETADLFKELDPEVTFDDKKPRRTYVRERPKRKRKQRVHILFIDSESSENDENEPDSIDSPKKKVPAVKRIRKDVEHEAKLKEFINSFNQECAEVEKYPMIVE